MPKLEITNAKGLVQRTGSTNIALADDVMHGERKKIEAITVATVLTVADSGKVFTVDADSGSYAITLPTNNANILGWNALFILTDVHATNDVTIVRGDTGNDVIVGNVLGADGSAADGMTISSNVITFDASGADAVGDLVEVFCFKSSASATKFVAKGIAAS